MTKVKLYRHTARKPRSAVMLPTSPHSSSPLACVWCCGCRPTSCVSFASEYRWRAKRFCQREACWWLFPEDGRGFRRRSQPTPCCEEAQQWMSASRLLKNQPQRHHLWPQCWLSQDPDPAAHWPCPLKPRRRLHVRPVRAARASIPPSLSLTLPSPTVPCLMSPSPPFP